MRLGYVTIAPIGQVDDVCPHCGAVLARRPGRKAACPECGAFIHVRRRPWDLKRVLVTAEEGERISGQWDAVGELKRSLAQLAHVEPAFQALLDQLREHGLSAALPWTRIREAASRQFRRDPFPEYLHLVDLASANDPLRVYG